MCSDFPYVPVLLHLLSELTSESDAPSIGSAFALWSIKSVYNGAHPPCGFCRARFGIDNVYRLRHHGETGAESLPVRAAGS